MKEFNGKKLLVIGGIKNECDIVKHAKEMGAYVYVVDYDEKAPAGEYADELVLISATDVDAIVEFCEKNKIDGVTTGFVDILLQPCYDVCRCLNLPFYATPQMLSMATNKIAFKESCEKYGVPVPKTYVIGPSISDNVLNSIQYPVFVKPLDSSGSRGAGVCKNQDELRKRFNDAVSYSASGNAIVEDYICGREFLLDYIAVDGEFRLLSIFDRFMASDRGSAVNYSTISMSPSRAVDYYLDNINDSVIKMFKGEGFTDGLMFMQGYYDGKRVTFFEMGCRLGGSYYNHEQACLGYNAVDMVIRYAFTGKMVNDIGKIDIESAKYKKYALDVNYLLKGEDETVDRIVGLKKVESLTSLVELQKFGDVGYHYVKDRTVDKPIIVAEIVVDNKDAVIRDVNYINEVFDVFNEKGDSLLMEKMNPEELFL